MTAALSKVPPQHASTSGTDEEAHKLLSIKLREALNAATSSAQIFQLWHAQNAIFNSYHLKIAFEQLEKFSYNRQAGACINTIQEMCTKFVGMMTNPEFKQSHTVFGIKSLARLDHYKGSWFPKFQGLFSSRRKEMPLATILAVAEACSKRGLGSCHFLRELTEEVMGKQAGLTKALVSQFVTNITEHPQYGETDKKVKAAMLALRTDYMQGTALVKKSSRNDLERAGRATPPHHKTSTTAGHKERAVAPQPAPTATAAAAAPLPPVLTLLPVSPVDVPITTHPATPSPVSPEEPPVLPAAAAATEVIPVAAPLLPDPTLLPHLFAVMSLGVAGESYFNNKYF